MTVGYFGQLPECVREDAARDFCAETLLGAFPDLIEILEYAAERSHELALGESAAQLLDTWRSIQEDTELDYRMDHPGELPNW
jgi:hypothetical protein